MKLHSMADVITNSSDTIFTCLSNHTVEEAEELVYKLEDLLRLSSGTEDEWCGIETYLEYIRKDLDLEIGLRINAPDELIELMELVFKASSTQEG